MTKLGESRGQRRCDLPKGRRRTDSSLCQRSSPSPAAAGDGERGGARERGGGERGLAEQLVHHNEPVEQISAAQIGWAPRRQRARLVLAL